MKKNKSFSLLILILLLSSFLVGYSMNYVSSSSDSEQLEQMIAGENLSDKDITDRFVEKVPNIESEEIVKEMPTENILDTQAPNLETPDLIQTIEGIQFLEKQTFSQDFTGIKLTVNNTPDVTQIYYERLSDNTITTYGLANEIIRVHIFVKGLISNGQTLHVEMRRDIVGWFDENHADGYYTFTSDLLGSETFHLIWDVQLDEDQNLFGLSSFDIRSYFLKIDIQSGPMLYDGSGKDTYKLWMCGYLNLYGVQYYNYTTEAGWVPVSYAVPGWDIQVTFYIAVVNAPIWDFDLQGTIKADVVWGIDESWYSDDEKTIDWIIEPGIYYYEWSDASWVPYHFTVPVDDYGNSPGDIRGLFGVMYIDGNEVDPLDPDY